MSATRSPSGTVTVVLTRLAGSTSTSSASAALILFGQRVEADLDAAGRRELPLATSTKASTEATTPSSLRLRPISATVSPSATSKETLPWPGPL